VASRTEKAGLILGLILAVLLILFLLWPEKKKAAEVTPEPPPPRPSKTPADKSGLPGSKSMVPAPDNPPEEEEEGPEGGQLDKAPPEAGGDDEGGIFDTAKNLIKDFYGISSTSASGSGYSGPPVE